jgi:hypothetical protein
MTVAPWVPKLVVAAVVYGGFLWTGYQRRKGLWSAGSWRRFAITLAFTTAAVAFAIRMAVGVDQGVYDGMTRAARTAYFYTMFVLLLVGTGGTAGLIIWFAKGKPERQFGGASDHDDRRRLTSA